MSMHICWAATDAIRKWHKKPRETRHGVLFSFYPLAAILKFATAATAGEKKNLFVSIRHCTVCFSTYARICNEGWRWRRAMVTLFRPQIEIACKPYNNIHIGRGEWWKQLDKCRSGIVTARAVHSASFWPAFVYRILPEIALTSGLPFSHHDVAYIPFVAPLPPFQLPILFNSLVFHFTSIFARALANCECKLQ